MMEVDLSGQCPGQLFTWWRTANEGICSFLIPTLMCMQIEGDEVAQRLLMIIGEQDVRQACEMATPCFKVSPEYTASSPDSVLALM